MNRGVLSLPWLCEKMSVQRSCAPSDRRGGCWHSWCGSAVGSVLTVRVREGKENASCMSASSNALAGLLFSFRISSPARRPKHTNSQTKVKNLPQTQRDSNFIDVSQTIFSVRLIKFYAVKVYIINVRRYFNKHVWEMIHLYYLNVLKQTCLCIIHGKTENKERSSFAPPSRITSFPVP